MEKLRLLLIGVGNFGSVHYRILSKRKDIELYVCDIDPAKLKQVDRRFKTTTDYTEFLPFVDVVDVVTPASTHYDIVKECLYSRLPVFCEKPLTTNREDTDDLLNISARLGLSLVVGYKFLYNPAVDFMKKNLKKLGKIYFIDAAFSMLKPPRYDDNVLGTYACHLVSIIKYLFGDDIEEVDSDIFQQYIYRKRYSDNVVVLVRLKLADEHVVYCSLVCNWLPPSENIQTMRISGERGGMLAFFIKNNKLEQEIILDLSCHKNGKVVKKKPLSKVWQADSLDLELTDFIKHCRANRLLRNNATDNEIFINRVLKR